MPFRIQTGDTEPIEIFVLDAYGQPLSGLSNLRLSVRRVSDDYFFDWADNTFKSSGISQQQVTLSEIDPINASGMYKLNVGGHVAGFNTSLIQNHIDGDTYVFMAVQDGSPDNASNMPQFGSVSVGGFIDFVDQAVSQNADPSEVTGALQALRLDQLVSSSAGGNAPAAGSFMQQMLDGLDPNASFVVLQSFSYSTTQDLFEGLVWVEKAGLVFAVVADMGSCEVNLYDSDGNLVHTVTDANPDTKGFYKVQIPNPNLSKETLYYAVSKVSISNVSGGFVSGGKGMFTI